MLKKIYSKNIHFKCQGSANCCVSRGSYGFVYLSLIDLKKISKFFKLDKIKFIRKYCEYTNGFLHLRETKKNGDCIFLKNKRCSIYSARPIQCRTWPFWEENMQAKKWNHSLKNFCPGIGKGKKINYLKIKKIVEKDKKNEKKTIFRKDLIS